MTEQVSKFPPEYLEQYSGNRLLATSIAFLVIDTFFVALRFLAQHLRPIKYGLDDLFIALAWLFMVLECAINIVLVRNDALGYHIQAQLLYRPEKIPFWGVWALYVFASVNVGANTFPKLAVLALYLRIFSTGRTLKYTCYGTAAILCVACIVNVFTLVFQCTPCAKAWNPSLPGNCNNIQAHFNLASVPNILTDVIMLIIPIPVILRLQMSKRNKVATLITFLVGSLGLITAIVRLAVFVSIDFALDGTWVAVDYSIYSTVEPSTYLISACLISCRSLINYANHGSKLHERVKASLHSLARPFSTSAHQHKHSVELGNVDDRTSERDMLRSADHVSMTAHRVD